MDGGLAIPSRNGSGRSRIPRIDRLGTDDDRSKERNGTMKYNNIDGIELGQFNEIMNELGYFDNEVFNMEDLDEILQFSQWEAIRAAFNGGRYGYVRDSFNPNDAYFTFDGYANLVSINEYYLQEYFDQFEDEILEYVNENEIELYGVEVEEDDQ